jgi:hypothetical protein
MVLGFAAAAREAAAARVPGPRGGAGGPAATWPARAGWPPTDCRRARDLRHELRRGSRSWSAVKRYGRRCSPATVVVAYHAAASWWSRSIHAGWRRYTVEGFLEVAAGPAAIVVLGRG